jgi:hypothetical protein
MYKTTCWSGLHYTFLCMFSSHHDTYYNNIFYPSGVIHAYDDTNSRNEILHTQTHKRSKMQCNIKRGILLPNTTRGKFIQFDNRSIIG